MRDPLGERALILLHEGLLRTAERHDEMRALDVLARRQRAGDDRWRWPGRASAGDAAHAARGRGAGALPPRARARRDAAAALTTCSRSGVSCEPAALRRLDRAGPGSLYGLLAAARRSVRHAGHDPDAVGRAGRPPRRSARRALGRSDEAIVRFEDALARLERLGARPLLARTRYELARTLLGAGRRRATTARPRAARRRARPRDRARHAGPGAPDRSRAAAPGRRARGDRRPPTLTVPSADAGARGRVSGRSRSPRGATFRLKDSLGLQYLARLVAEPGREIHVLELVRGPAAATSAAADGGDAGELLDDEARAEYRPPPRGPARHARRGRILRRHGARFERA